eukprot:scaffold12583_cov72-Phaeocystis_antarctica.AAC.3
MSGGPGWARERRRAGQATGWRLGTCVCARSHHACTMRSLRGHPQLNSELWLPRGRRSALAAPAVLLQLSAAEPEGVESP